MEQEMKNEMRRIENLGDAPSSPPAPAIPVVPIVRKMHATASDIFSDLPPEPAQMVEVDSPPANISEKPGLHRYESSGALDLNNMPTLSVPSNRQLSENAGASNSEGELKNSAESDELPAAAPS